MAYNRTLIVKPSFIGHRGVPLDPIELNYFYRNQAILVDGNKYVIKNDGKLYEKRLITHNDILPRYRFVLVKANQYLANEVLLKFPLN